MKPSPPDDAALERLIHATLSEQPLRQAPDGLEAQVLAAIARRDARSWWRRDFARWPLAARAGFVVLCIVLGKFAVDASMWLVTGLDPIGIAAELGALVMWMKMLAIAAASVARSIPTTWIYSGALAAGAMYALLFGLSTLAYRTLYATANDARM